MLEKVTERIYYLMNDDKNERPALGLVKGDKSFLIIDAGNSTEHAQMFLNEIKEMDLPKRGYVIVTHHHWDHIFGLESFEAVKIASHKTRELARIYWGLRRDDASLEEAKANKILDDIGIKILKDELGENDELKEMKFDLLFTGELEIDLGGVTCLIKEIINPHREDGTIVYVPDEKTLFLGDAAYGSTKNGKSYFDREKLISMMEEVNNYDANYYLCSHESICDKEEIKWYFNKLKMGIDITLGCHGKEDIIRRFKEVYNREPSEDDMFFLESIYE